MLHNIRSVHFFCKVCCCGCKLQSVHSYCSVASASVLCKSGIPNLSIDLSRINIQQCRRALYACNGGYEVACAILRAFTRYGCCLSVDVFMVDPLYRYVSLPGRECIVMHTQDLYNSVMFRLTRGELQFEIWQMLPWADCMISISVVIDNQRCSYDTQQQPTC